MKKLLLLAAFGLFLAGCGTHTPTWKNWHHFKYSAWGYRNPTEQTGKMSDAQDWWGKEIPYIPAD